MSATELLAALQVLLAGFMSSAAQVAPIFATLFVASFVDLLSGIYAAWTSVPRTFDAKFLPAWIDSHSTKILRITLILISAVAVGGIDTVLGLGLVTLGGTEAGLYLAAVVGSIKGNTDDARANAPHLPSFGGKGTGVIELETRPSNDPVDETDFVPGQP